MPSGGTSLQQREARAFDERTRAATRELCRVMLGIARPELLPEAPLGQFLREDAAVRIKKMRARADREDFPEPATVPPSPVACAGPEEAPKPAGKRGRDRTVYLFVLPGGAEVHCTRWELQQRVPGVNPGSLADLVHGVIRQAKGVRCLGQVERTSG